MNTENKDAFGNIALFPGAEDQRERSGENRSPEAEEAPENGEVLLRTLEEPFESAGRNRRIARLREKILAGTYHVSSLELAERMIDGDNF